MSEGDILRQMLTYLWPTDNPEVRRRVVLAAILLLMSKVTNVTVGWEIREGGL